MDSNAHYRAFEFSDLVIFKIQNIMDSNAHYRAFEFSVFIFLCFYVFMFLCFFLAYTRYYTKTKPPRISARGF